MPTNMATSGLDRSTIAGGPACLCLSQAARVRVSLAAHAGDGNDPETQVERFIRTLDEEWAHGRIWASSARRARALSSWMRYYNRRRPHSSLGDRSPISRVQQERGQYT